MQEEAEGAQGFLAPLQPLIKWLEQRLKGGVTSDEEDLLDDNSRIYLQSHQDQFTRFSLFQVKSAGLKSLFSSIFCLACVS